MGAGWRVVGQGEEERPAHHRGRQAKDEEERALVKYLGQWADHEEGTKANDAGASQQAAKLFDDVIIAPFELIHTYRRSNPVKYSRFLYKSPFLLFDGIFFSFSGFIPLEQQPAIRNQICSMSLTFRSRQS